jgi:hypothetical protein
VLLELLQWDRPEIRILQPPSTTVAPSSTDDINVEPKSAEEEWVIVGVVNIESAGVDGADTLSIQYRDVPVANGFALRQAVRSNYQSGTQQWPGSTGLGSNEQYIEPTRPLVLKLKNSGDPWQRLRLRLTTTGTAGNRTHTVQVIYVARTRLLA